MLTITIFAPFCMVSPRIGGGVNPSGTSSQAGGTLIVRPTSTSAISVQTPSTSSAITKPSQTSSAGTASTSQKTSILSEGTTNPAKQDLADRVTALQKNFIVKVIAIQGLFTAGEYANAVTAINQLLANEGYLPKTAELDNTVYKTNAQKLGTVITNLIATVGIRTSNKKKLTIKPAYKNSISFENFKKMLTSAKEFARGFTNAQNTTITSSLLILKKQ